MRKIMRNVKEVMKVVANVGLLGGQKYRDLDCINLN